MRWIGLAVVALVAFGGCLEKPQSGRPPAGDEPAPQSDRMTMTLEMTDDDLAPGDTTRLTGTATNHDDEDFVYQHPGCPPGGVRFFVVVDGDERPIPGEAIAGACVITEQSVPPGESVGDGATWDGRIEGERLAAGTYTVVARLNAAEAPYPVEDSGRLTVR